MSSCPHEDKLEERDVDGPCGYNPHELVRQLMRLRTEAKQLRAIVDKVRAELEGPGELFDCVQEIRNVLTRAAAQAAKENK